MSANEVINGSGSVEVNEFLNAVAKKHGTDIERKTRQELKKWDPGVTYDTFYDRDVLRNMLSQALED